MPVHTVKLGTTYGTLALLSSYSVTNPDLVTPYVPYSRIQNLASGGARGQGTAALTWQWKALSTAERTALRAICTGASAEFFIESPDENYSNQVYEATMLWPDIKPDKAHLFPFTLQFINLTVYTP